jgi:hypothetical protein
LDPKQATALSVICSSFVLAFLNNPTITKIGTDIEKENATRILLEKGANSSLIMHLTVFIVSATTNAAVAQVHSDTIHNLAGL